MTDKYTNISTSYETQSVSFPPRLHCTRLLLTHIMTFLMTRGFPSFHNNLILLSFNRHTLRQLIQYKTCCLGENSEAYRFHSDYHTLHFSSGFIGVPLWHWNASEKASKFCKEPKTLMWWDRNRDDMVWIIIYAHTYSHFITHTLKKLWFMWNETPFVVLLYQQHKIIINDRVVRWSKFTGTTLKCFIPLPPQQFTNDYIFSNVLKIAIHIVLFIHFIVI